MPPVKSDWERRAPLLDLSMDEVAAMLRPAFPNRRIQSAEAMAGGLVNTNYRLRLDGVREPLLLRIYVRDPGACAREQAILALVHGRVPVPRVFHAAPDSGPGSRPYAVMEWVEGVPLADLVKSGDPQEVRQAAASAGRALAAIGTFRFPSGGFLSPDLTVEVPLSLTPGGYVQTMRDMLAGPASESLGKRLAAAAEGCVERHAGRLEDIADDHSLVHSDYGPSNILVRDDGAGWQVAAVLDWEFSFAGTSLFDIGNMLRGESVLPQGFAEAFIRGFRDGGGRLPGDWRGIARVLDLLSLCSMLVDGDTGPRATGAIRSLVAETVRNLEA